MPALKDLLPPDGIVVLAQFVNELERRHSEDMLDLHVDLRERLRPFEGYLAERGMVDLDYFAFSTLTLLLRVRAAQLPPGEPE